MNANQIRTLKLLRLSKGLTSHDLDAALGLSKSRIGQLENAFKTHYMRVDELHAVCEYFQVSVEDFMHRRAVISFQDIAEEE